MLFVKVFSAGGIPAKGNYQCKVKLLEQSKKGKVIKNTNTPVWDDTFDFFLSGIDINSTDIEIVLYNNHHFVGEVIKPLSELRILGEGRRSETIQTLTSTQGEIDVEFIFDIKTKI